MNHFVLAVYIECRDGSAYTTVLHRGTEAQCVGLMRKLPEKIKTTKVHAKITRAKVGVFEAHEWDKALEKMEAQPTEAVLEA